MGDLVLEFVGKDIRIVGLPLGSNNPDEWTTFHEAARQAPEVLFIAFAGDRGIDLGPNPGYPASSTI